MVREATFGELMEKQCNEKGIQKDSNLDKQQIRGKVKLEARTKSGEIVFTQTDKSGKNSIIQREIYKQMGNPHVSKDEKAT